MQVTRRMRQEEIDMEFTTIREMGELSGEGRDATKLWDTVLCGIILQ